MFGNIPLFSNVPTTPPKDVPPPTPVNFPRYFPELTSENAGPSSGSAASGSANKLPLTAILQTIVRPTDIALEHFQALGVHIKQNAEPTAVIPEYHSLVPDFATWNDISYDDARELNESTRRPLNNGNKSPGIQTYLDRRRELSIDNSAAYRSVRRMQPLQPGQPAVRLGNAYEFYRHLESFSAFWDDTSMAPPPDKDESKSSSPPSDAANTHDSKTTDEQGEKSEDAAGGDGNESGCDSVSSASSTAVTTDSESKPSSPAKDGTPSVPEFRFYRTNAGSQMPPEYRLHMITAFLKLVAYDFGCNVSAPRTEPRLYLNAGTITLEEAQALDRPPPPKGGEAKDQAQAQNQPRPVQTPKRTKAPSSYFSSGCIFVFRTPLTRDAARTGFVDGPLAAVSARHTTTFSNPEDSAADKDSSIDLARELVAGLLTAQHRAREGRAERRIGKGEWWATKPRWGGGSGGPIGREVDSAPNTDEIPINTEKAEGAGTNPSAGAAASGSATGLISASAAAAAGSGSPPPRPRFSTGRGSGGLSSGGGGGGGRANLMNALESAFSITDMPVRGASKKPRKGLAIYDNYRMVRPPSSSWDKKTRYQAIGRKIGADYDDIFVVSALFHHMSIVRMRVPQKLLQALDGEDENAGEATLDEKWSGLEVVRSPWYDFFKVKDRLKAMQLSWAMMAYLMREQDTDVKMAGAS